MKIFTVVKSDNNSFSPNVQVLYYDNLEEAQKAFYTFLKKVGDNYSTLLVEEFDTVTKKAQTHDSFEGNEDDLVDEGWLLG